MAGRLLAAIAAVWLGGVVLAGGAVCADEPAGAGADAASASIRFYQRYLSGVRHARCRFRPSCSQYALDAIAAYGVVGGTSRAADRLMRCNAAAGGLYARGEDGRLLDPAAGETPERSVVLVPGWLMPGDPPPDASCLDPGGGGAGDGGRIAETFGFGRLLADGGDCLRAETEFRRAAFLKSTPSAMACASRASARCWFESSGWGEAEERFLEAAMLEPEPRRAGDVHRAAVCRFNAGDPAGCAGLLAEFAPGAPLVAAVGAPSTAADGEALAAGLAGLCSMRRGLWDDAVSALGRAAALTPDPAMTRRFESLAASAREGPDLPRARPGLASGLSALVPGAGQLYTGRPSDGIRTLLVNGALIWTVVALAREGYEPAAFVVGGITVPFYLGNIRGAGAGARMANRARRSEHLARSLEAVER